MKLIKKLVLIWESPIRRIQAYALVVFCIPYLLARSSVFKTGDSLPIIRLLSLAGLLLLLLRMLALIIAQVVTPTTKCVNDRSENNVGFVQEWIYIWDSRTGADRIETLLNNREALIRDRGVSIKGAQRIYAWWLFLELFSILFCKFERVYKVFKPSKD